MQTDKWLCIIVILIVFVLCFSYLTQAPDSATNVTDYNYRFSTLHIDK